MSVMKESSQLIPVDEYDGFRIRPGFFLENGAVAIPGGVSFTVQTQEEQDVNWCCLKEKPENLMRLFHFPKNTESDMCIP